MMAKSTQNAQISKSQVLPCGRPLPKNRNQPENTSSFFDSAKVKLNAFVAEKSLKRSEAREKILKTIIYEARHFRAQDLLDRLKDRYPEVGKATLYRTLPILIESGIIQEGPTDSDGQILYELTDTSHHDHIVCLDCQRIFEFHDKFIEKQQEKVSGALRFTARTHRHVIYASCDYKKTKEKTT